MTPKTADEKNTNSDETADGENLWVESYKANEITALFMIGFAAIIFLSLFSHNSSDLLLFDKSGAEQASSNYVGPIGATIAHYLYFAFGFAANLLHAVFMWWAAQILATKRSLRSRNIIALLVCLASTSCIFDCQTLFLQEWAETHELTRSIGGFVGYYLGNQVFVRFFGPGGTFIIMSTISILTLVVITGIHPFRFTKMVGEKIADFFQRVDWEEKWSLWSGVKPKKEQHYPATRILTTQAITVEPAIRAEERTHIDTFEVRPDMDGESEIEVEEEAPIVAPLEPTPRVTSHAVKPERVRKVTDTSHVNNAPQVNYVPPPASNPANHVSFTDQARFEGYQLPPLDILNYAPVLDTAELDDALHIEIQNNIVSTLNSFKVEVEPGDITIGPTVTRYELYPSPGLRVNKITTLKDDIARATRAERINILAPIPGKDTVGIEIANSNKVTVALRELFENEAFRTSNAKLPLVLGKDVYGETIIGDLARMPHLLVAGATGSGKSVCINSIIASLLYRFTPDELKFIMIDPKVVEMQLYNALPHLVVPVVTDPKKVVLALRWVIKEMERRYTMFAKKGVRSFDGFNTLRAKEKRGMEIAEQQMLQPNLINTETGEDIFSDDEIAAAKSQARGDDGEFPEKLPYIVVIIDELADLMQTAPADVETSIARIAQKARAAGIHLVIATQTPRADVVTGTIKANVPSRIAFQVSSKTDSRIILDENGAENLVGKGDMLYLPPGSAQLIRAQGALITDDEAQLLVNACAAQGEPDFLAGDSEDGGFGFFDEDEGMEVSDADEEVISRCMEVIFTEKKASTSLLQRKLRLGYTRAARMIDILESRGIIGPGDGAKPREILIDVSSVD
ncbi:MAG: DNA translocase FtsK [Verrucomicrobiales bacterium]|nr:DNA translocase FtsK [Verrucomicrobiales bacterium]